MENNRKVLQRSREFLAGTIELMLDPVTWSSTFGETGHCDVAMSHPQSPSQSRACFSQWPVSMLTPFLFQKLPPCPSPGSCFLHYSASPGHHSTFCHLPWKSHITDLIDIENRQSPLETSLRMFGGKWSFLIDSPSHFSVRIAID